MKKIIRSVMLIALLMAHVFQGAVFAHSGHNVINSETALNIANRSVKQLTFRDLGFEIGKLDASWKLLTDANFSVLQVLNKTFIVSATNTASKSVIYFEIAKNGKVGNIKDTN